jgi:hypothetical protein
MNYLNGVLVHWRGRTERLIVHTTAAGEYIALSRGNATAKYIRDIMIFYGNTQNIYHLYTDNQAAEHIATQPNMNDHSRSIDIRIHGIRQDYLDNAMRIGGVASEENTSDILTKNLQPHLHQKHCQQLHLTKQRKQKNGTQNALTLTSRRQTPLRLYMRKTNKLHPRTNQCHSAKMPTKISRQLPSPLEVEPNPTNPHQTPVHSLDLPHARICRQLVPLVNGEEGKLVEQLEIPLNAPIGMQATCRNKEDWGHIWHASHLPSPTKQNK